MHVTSPFTAPKIFLVNITNHNQPLIPALQVDISKNMAIGRGEGRKKGKIEKSYRGRVWLKKMPAAPEVGTRLPARSRR
jgi:hypothetical protein